MMTDQLEHRVLGEVYRLDRLISAGSSSVVYRGTHLRLDQPLAIKVLANAGWVDHSSKSRFESEARVQATLNHPHIVKVFDFIAENGIYAIVMEYIDGMGLDQIMHQEAGPLPGDRILHILRPILAAVDHAHRRGIIHRDLKPSNILVSQVDGEDFPRVVDFGIAKVLADRGSATVSGQMMGTLLFMSPEQCKAQKGVDLRADIYSLGITLYQMATGMVPFYAESAFDIMLAHVESAPTPPRHIIPDLGQALENVILQAIAKDPADRFQSAAGMAEALETAIATSVETSDPDEIFDRQPTNLSVPHTSLPAVDLGKSGAQPAREFSASEVRTPASCYEKSDGGTIRLRLRVDGLEKWSEYYDRSVVGGGIFVPTRTPPAIGQPTRVELTFPDGPRVFLQGMVTWRRTHAHNLRARAGCGIQIHPQEQGKIVFLEQWMRGGADEKRDLRRLPLRLRVAYSARSGRRVNFTRDINESGIFIRAREVLEVGTPISLLLMPPNDAKPIPVGGIVVRRVKEQLERGMGIKLKFGSESELSKFEATVAKLESELLSGNLPDDVLG